MGRGGKRDGAGRKSLLDEEEEISIGSICERMWQDMATQAAWSEYEGRSYVKDVRSSQQELQNIPVRDRVGDEAMRAVDEATVLITDSIRYAKISAEELSDSVEANDKLAKERGGPEPVTITRPYDAKNWVLTAGVKWAQVQFDKTISARTAERCWEIFKKLEASSRDAWKPPG